MPTGTCWRSSGFETTSVARDNPQPTQCQKPRGWQGRLTLWRMNLSHSGVTDWGLTHISVGIHDIVLDVGCGGGRTIAKLAARWPRGWSRKSGRQPCCLDTAQ